MHQQNGISKVQRCKFTLLSAGGDAGAKEEEQEEVRQKQLDEFQCKEVGRKGSGKIEEEEYGKPTTPG